jgi:sugar/nucleoside kinase (ribokinase family)
VTRESKVESRQSKVQNEAGNRTAASGSSTQRTLRSTADSHLSAVDSRLSTVDFVAYSGLIIDDIVLPDGRTFMNTLGGSATHALIGMRVWSDRLGYFAAVGADFSPEHRDQLEGIGVDLRGLLSREGYPTARAWQLFEPDERRIEIFRTSIDDFYTIEPTLDEMPPDYFAARGFHVCHGTLADLTSVAARLRAANPTARIVWEPTPVQNAGTPEAVAAALAQVDVISPDRGEAMALTGRDTPEDAVAALMNLGAKNVALRMGSEGSRVDTAAGESFRIPAIPAPVVDTTGAGDAYCGGFLVALAGGADPADAGAYAAVSASFAIEQFGVPTFTGESHAEAQRRLAWAQERITAGNSIV